MDLKFHFMLMNDHFSIQILSELSFNVFSKIGVVLKLFKTALMQIYLKHYKNNWTWNKNPALSIWMLLKEFTQTLVVRDKGCVDFIFSLNCMGSDFLSNSIMSDKMWQREREDNREHFVTSIFLHLNVCFILNLFNDLIFWDYEIWSWI